jgi:hypothetical protein
MSEGGLRFEVDTAVLESDAGTTVHLFQSADSANGFGPRYLDGEKGQSCNGRLAGDRQSYAFLLPKPDFSGLDSSGTGAGAVKAPMPGKVRRRHLSTLELLSSLSQYEGTLLVARFFNRCSNAMLLLVMSWKEGSLL